jgi:hypothetical protein
MFGIIISDLFLIFTPLLPSFTGTLPLALGKPAAIGIGLGFACSVLIFPHSTSRIVLNSIEDLIELLTHPLAFTMASLGKSGTDLDLAQLRKTHIDIVNEYKKMESALAFLPLDLSIGFWGAEHVVSLKEPVRQVVGSILSLHDFHMNQISGKARTKEVLLKYVDQIEVKEKKENPSHEVGRHQLSQMARWLDELRNADSAPVSEETVQILVSTASKAIETCVVSLCAAKDCIVLVNGPLWLGRPSPAEREHIHQRGHTTLEDLRAVRKDFEQETTQLWVSIREPEMQSMSENDTHPRHRQLGGIVFGLVFQELMCHALDTTETLLDQILHLSRSAERVDIWWPMSIKALVAWVFSKGKAPAMSQVVDDDPEKSSDSAKFVQEQLRISHGYRVQRRSMFGRVILGTYHWFTSNEGLYAFRVLVVTIAVGIISALPSTAGFFYREKGIWALIMAQTGLVPYMADFVFSVMSRVVATVVGGVLGLLAWYIGSANGPGNPFGLAAVLAVFLVPMLWIRLYLPPSLLQGGIMGAATFLLVVAYGYDDT